MYCDWPLLGRCCFCIPLRKGILIFAYIGLVYYVLMISLYSTAIHRKRTLGKDRVYRGRALSLSEEVTIALYCIEMLFNIILIYGTHKKSVLPLKIFFYFTLAATPITLIPQMIDVITERLFWTDVVEILTLLFGGVCLNLYLITVVRSLIKKLEADVPHIYDNQLHQIVEGDIKTENNSPNTNDVPTKI